MGKPHLTSITIQETVTEVLRQNDLDTGMIQHLQDQWKNRADAHKTRTTQQHQQTQARLLPLLAIPEALRWTTFLQIANTLKWKATVKDAYWAAMGSAATILSVPKTKISQDAQRNARAEALKCQTWSEDNPRQHITVEYINALEVIMVQEPYQAIRRLMAAMILTFLLGQRFGDTLKWQRREVRTRQFYQQDKSFALGVVEGKTVEQTGQYTVHCPTTSRAGRLLQNILLGATGKYLFLFSPSYLSREAIRQQVEQSQAELHRHLVKISMDIDFRALRRGGLTRMAVAGFPNATIRLFSRHTTDQQLEVYLMRGSFAGGTAKIQAEVIAKTESMNL